MLGDALLLLLEQARTSSSQEPPQVQTEPFPPSLGSRNPEFATAAATGGAPYGDRESRRVRGIPVVFPSTARSCLRLPRCSWMDSPIPEVPVPLCPPPKKGDTPSPPADTSDGDVELSAARHQPEGLEELQAHTKFTKKELQSLYRGFKNVSTAGWGPPLAFGDTPIAGLPVAIALSSPRTVPAATWTRRPSRSSTRSSSRREVSRGCITPPL